MEHNLKYKGESKHGKIVTEEEKEEAERELLLARKPTIARTPPTKSRSNPATSTAPQPGWEDARIAISSDEGEEYEAHRPSKKRKARKSPPCGGIEEGYSSDMSKKLDGKADEEIDYSTDQSAASGEVRTDRLILERENWEDMLRQIDVTYAIIRELRALVKECTNTKTVIKSKSKTLMMQANILIKKTKIAKENATEGKREREKPTVSDAGTQTKKMTMDETTRKRELEEIDRTMKEGAGFQNLAKILDLAWEDKTYTRTEMEKTDPTRLSGEWDLAMIEDHGTESNRSTMHRRIAERFPETSKLMEDVMTENEVIDFIKISRSIESRSGTQVEEKRYYYRIHYEPGAREIESLYESLEKLYEMTKEREEGRTQIAYVIPPEVNEVYARKMIEYIYRDHESSKVKVLTLRRSGKKADASANTRNETLIVSADGTNYAEMVRKIKDKVDIEGMGVRVKAARKTAKGDLLLRVNAEGKIAQLKEAITRAVDKKVTTGGKKVIYITDITAGTTEEEVTAAVVNELQGSEIKLKAVRPTRDGNQMAIMEIEARAARAVIDKGSIKIGWINCRVMERTEITRCYRCLGFGHVRSKCTGEEDRSNACLRCGSNDHKVKDCSESAHCRGCNAGHREDSTQCPIFRRLLKEAREGGGTRRSRPPNV